METFVNTETGFISGTIQTILHCPILSKNCNEISVPQIMLRIRLKFKSTIEFGNFKKLLKYKNTYRYVCMWELFFKNDKTKIPIILLIMHKQIKCIKLINWRNIKNIIKMIHWKKCVTSSSQVRNNHDIFLNS